MLDHEIMMRHAISVAEANEEAPFGAILVDRVTRIIYAEGINRKNENPIWHAEIDVINKYAAKAAKVHWSELELYSTAEPCPMCQSAILWAGIRHVIYGSSIAELIRLGWNQIDCSSTEILERADFAECHITSGVLQDQCDSLFRTALKNRIFR